MRSFSVQYLQGYCISIVILKLTKYTEVIVRTDSKQQNYLMSSCKRDPIFLKHKGARLIIIEEEPKKLNKIKTAAVRRYPSITRVM